MTEPKSKFVPTTPTSIDAFAAKSHTKSAQHILQCIDLLGGQGGAIGIQGSWGSGKSTAIKIALDDLAEQAGLQCKQVTFDLWEYQKDDFRESFLNFFADWAKNSDELSEDQYKKFDTRINARIEEVDDDRKVRLTWQSILLLILLLLLPVSYLWLSPFAHLGKNSNPPIVATIVAFTIPGILLIGLIACFWERARTFLSDSLAILTKKGDYITRKTTIRGTNPSTYEFKEILSDLLDAATWKEPRIILTLDNLDRLTDKKLIDTWTHLRSLVATAESSKAPGRLILLVPFDADHVLRAHSKGKYETDSNPSETDDSIEKVFDISVDIHEPILSEWSSFLTRLIDTYVAGNRSYSKHIVAKLFDESISANGLICTPRLIISFVNKLALYHKFWQDDIPIEVIAAYIAYKDSRFRDHRSLQTAQPLPPRASRLLSSFQWRKAFSAMYFNVDIGTANQTLLGEEVRQALIGGDISRLEDVLDIEGGPLVLGEVIERNADDWAGSEAQVYPTVA